MTGSSCPGASGASTTVSRIAKSRFSAVTATWEFILLMQLAVAHVLDGRDWRRRRGPGPWC